MYNISNNTQRHNTIKCVLCVIKYVNLKYILKQNNCQTNNEPLPILIVLQ